LDIASDLNCTALLPCSSFSQHLPPNCDGSTEWFLRQFDKAALEGLFGPLPASSRQQFGWLATVRKEGNSLRVILYEKNEEDQIVSTPEDAGSPICHFFGPKLELKMRCATLEAIDGWLVALYQGRVTCAQRPFSHE
jgi:hypothetical protein